MSAPLFVREVPLGKSGRVALLDPIDHDRLARFRWCICRQGQVAYARRTVKRNGKVRTLYLHREVMRAPDHLVVDHINGDGLDCRRSNLRLVTQAANVWNMGPRHGTSKFVGVAWHVRHQSWIARIQVDGEQLHLGYYDDEVEAARARDLAAIAHFGEMARLNFPVEEVVGF